MKVVVVMTYYKREQQLKRTLSSIEQSKNTDFSVIIVDDCSEDGLKLPNATFKCDLITITKEEKIWKDGAPAYNRGIIEALKLHPEVIIIQNAECIHIGDVISYSAENINNHNYIPFKCLSLDEKTTFDDSIDLVTLTHSIKHGASNNGDLAWYNHPIYRPCNLDFCCAISVQNLITLNGYDERFMYGYAYGDNYWKYRVELLKLKFIVPPEPLVAHQWHYAPWYSQMVTPELGNKNRILYEQFIKEGRKRAEHLITPDFDTL
jgi:glycosyltransferase involved in cell wall biosynthesis